jgi:hypothetical protein
MGASLRPALKSSSLFREAATTPIRALNRACAVPHFLFRPMSL